MKTAILFSGGWDSVAVALKAKSKNADLVFINYGQTYYINEKKSAHFFANQLKLSLYEIELNLKHDQYRRNFFMIMELIRLEYRVIYIGSRNLISLFDKYKDSNWFSLKVLSILLGIKIKMPIAGYRKRQIVELCRKSIIGRPYNCYKNSLNFSDCDCVNCTEIRQIDGINT